MHREQDGQRLGTVRLIGVAALALTLGGCGSSSVERHFAITGFDRVRVVGGDRIEMTTGQPFAVSARGQRELIDKVHVRRDGTTLVIERGRSPRMHWSGWGWWRAFASDRVRITVALPRLARVESIGAPRIDVDTVRGEAFEARMEGAGRIDIDELSVQRARFDLAGAGEVRAEGHVAQLIGRLKGAGELRLRRLRADQADIEVAGAGSVRAAVEGPARVATLGAGKVDLGTKARCTITRDGIGKVRCG